MKQTISLFLICIFLNICSFKASAQNISGKVTDEENTPLEFVTVTTYALPDFSLIDGCLIDKQGKVQINKSVDTKNSFLKVSFVGYQTQYVQASTKLRSLC
ncbi:MAG: hypothetical protein ACK5MI_00735 [Mangrovibacterium sp.]